ncbi:MAG TPA: 16S rRNA (cytosine(1402)-N(4))-methyltransferase RsmH [bacterium]|nr:16S rRNA (cytosine(1402)-N(4))-methyltransferase RsmH [bacterium]HPG45612.1 16S rRNA (cytosine(1402)-N(4))-methyltransferase RsmH [bacterium]HPM97609.1 16S rRNA (cytosine(1402)-N(4))-methyltransferase RsmH [bacterium]
MRSADYHIPVLAEEVADGLRIAQVSRVVDGTLGDGGYSLCFLERSASVQVIGIDLDRDAIERAGERLAGYGDRFRAVQGNFSDIDTLVGQLGVEDLEAIVVDLGISRLQVTDPAKGFMFSKPGPLLMRMGGASRVDAGKIVNEWDEKMLAQLLWEYGEERRARWIARAIVRARSNNPITMTDELAEVVRRAVPHDHAVKSLARVFQAIRIAVNDELNNLRSFLPKALQLLRPQGRLAVVSYHSLEDRICKEFFASQIRPCTCPPDLPICVCGKQPTIRWVERLVRPSEAEVQRNPNARSAKLRITERL